jgi:hypothetical protein
MDIAAAFAVPEKTIRFAQEATDELKVEIADFFAHRHGEFARILVEIDPDTGENVQKLKIVSQISESIERKATEALNNARHSFDQSLNAACSILKGRPTNLNYPWTRDLGDLDGRLKNPDIDVRLRDSVRAHQPYRTSDGHPFGNDLVRVIATIANRKHNLGLAVAGEIASIKHPPIKGSVQSLRIPMPKWDAMKNEAELMRWKGELEIGPKYEIEFYIRFDDARLLEPVELVFALNAFTAKAHEVCESLKAKCLELAA